MKSSGFIDPNAKVLRQNSADDLEKVAVANLRTARHR